MLYQYGTGTKVLLVVPMSKECYVYVVGLYVFKDLVLIEILSFLEKNNESLNFREKTHKIA